MPVRLPAHGDGGIADVVAIPPEQPQNVDRVAWVLGGKQEAGGSIASMRACLINDGGKRCNCVDLEILEHPEIVLGTVGQGEIVAAEKGNDVGLHRSNARV